MTPHLCRQAGLMSCSLQAGRREEEEAWEGGGMAGEKRRRQGEGRQEGRREEPSCSPGYLWEEGRGEEGRRKEEEPPTWQTKLHLPARRKTEARGLPTTVTLPPPYFSLAEEGRKTL